MTESGVLSAADCQVTGAMMPSMATCKRHLCDPLSCWKLQDELLCAYVCQAVARTVSLISTVVLQQVAQKLVWKHKISIVSSQTQAHGAVCVTGRDADGVSLSNGCFSGDYARGSTTTDNCNICSAEFAGVHAKMSGCYCGSRYVCSLLQTHMCAHVHTRVTGQILSSCSCVCMPGCHCGSR